MLQSFKKWGLLPLLVILLFSLTAAACGNNTGTQTGNGGTGEASASGSDAASGNAAQDAKFPITIKHDKGETVLNEKPKKVAITYFPYADHLFAIGEQDVVAGVVGLKSLQNFPVYDPYTKQDKIADLGDTASMESILALDPDVIIAWEDDEKIYDQLSKIAPTILIRQSENWQDTIEKVAAVIGEEDKAKQYVADYNAKLDALAAKMDETGAKGKTAIFMMTWGKGFNYYGGVRMEPYYDRLGFAKFDGMEDWAEISLEGVADVNPDYIFLGEDFTGAAELTLDELADNPVWNGLKAVKNGNLHVIDTEIVGPLAMGQSKGLDVIGQIMEK
ncbi:ABC transporter substrate-binding protein [Paenibacillus timonensis]|uniref:ABC transporter substrate-binding protein n=1 Tax=Paenibacillus timonensis TaxID=225915 RepID=A0ABW3SGM6_9BACL|nr:ABC transporter substrate-binding protein [Paenibacillus timonensis]MCH1641403.1 ABC transporter substrate-binding protein [Paenibacillus timonensis]